MNLDFAASFARDGVPPHLQYALEWLSVGKGRRECNRDVEGILRIIYNAPLDGRLYLYKVLLRTATAVYVILLQSNIQALKASCCSMHTNAYE